MDTEAVVGPKSNKAMGPSCGQCYKNPHLGARRWPAVAWPPSNFKTAILLASSDMDPQEIPAVIADIKMFAADFRLGFFFDLRCINLAAHWVAKELISSLPSNWHPVIPSQLARCLSVTEDTALGRNSGVGTCDEKMDTNIPFLPAEIIFDILVRLRADILYNVMRLVCRKWYNIIHDPRFITANLSRSPAGLLIQRCSEPNFTFFLETVKGTENLKTEIPNGRSVACCDGLVLIRLSNHCQKVLWVVNPITKQHVTLPLLPDYLSGHDGYTLVSGPSTMEYKVLLVCHNGITNCLCLAIFTLGVDNAWRTIDVIKFASKLYCNMYHHYHQFDHFPSNKPAIAVSGFFYWCDCESRSPTFAAIEMETEIVYQVPLPEGVRGYLKEFIKSETSLILAYPIDGAEWEFWALTNTKAREDILILRNYSSGIYVAYNIKMRQILRYWKLGIMRNSFGDNLDIHVNSLVALKMLVKNIDA
ncbi:hypothetical protein LguiB_028530 [Lonicera macranthoides]